MQVLAATRPARLSGCAPSANASPCATLRASLCGSWECFPPSRRSSSDGCLPERELERQFRGTTAVVLRSVLFERENARQTKSMHHPSSTPVTPEGFLMGSSLDQRCASILWCRGRSGGLAPVRSGSRKEKDGPIRRGRSFRSKGNTLGWFRGIFPLPSRSDPTVGPRGRIDTSCGMISMKSKEMSIKIVGRTQEGNEGMAGPANDEPVARIPLRIDTSNGINPKRKASKGCWRTFPWNGRALSEVF